MPFHVVGAVAIKVRPDSDGFGKEARAQVKKELRGVDGEVELTVGEIKRGEVKRKAKAASEGAEIEIPVKVDDKELDGAAISRRVGIIRQRLKSDKLTVDLDVGTRAALAKVKGALHDAQRSLDRSELVAPVIMDLKMKEARRKFEEELQKEKLRLKAVADIDAADYQRQVERLQRNGKLTLTPDIDKTFEELRATKVEINAELDLKRDRLQRNLDALTKIEPLLLSADPDINTKEVQAQWEKLKHEIEADRIDIQFDTDRLKTIEGLVLPIADIEVDKDAIGRTMRSALRNVRSTLYPDVELDKKQLRDINVELDAGINIRKAEVQRKLDELARLEQLVLSVDPKVNTEEVRKQWDHLKRELDGDVVELKADLDRQSKIRAQLAELTRNRHVDLIIRINQRSIATAKATLEALAGVNVLRRASQLVERIGTNLDNYALKLGKIGVVLGNLGSTLGSGTASLFTFGAQLGQLGGFLLGAPAGFLALGAAAGAAIIGFRGLGDAIGASEEELRALPDNMANAARAINKVWTEIQGPVRDAFWDGMGNSLADFLTTSLPQLKSGMSSVARELGHLLNDGLQGLTEFARRGDLQKLLDNLAEGLKNAAPGAFSMSDAFVTLGSAGAKYFPRIGDYLADMAEKFDQWIRKAEQSGKINEWMENAVDTASKLKNSFKDIVGIFGGVADAARRAGGGGIDAFAAQMERIRGIVEGPTFQGTMTTLFDGARQGAKALYDALGPMGDTLVSLAPTLKTVFISVGETLGGLVSSIAKAMQSPIFDRGLTDLFGGIQKGMEGLSKFLPGIVDGLGSLGSILGSVFASVLPAVGRGFEVVAGAFEEMRPTLQEVGQSLGGIVMSGMDALSGVLPLLTGPLTLVLDLFNALPAPVQAGLAAFILFNPVAKGMVGILGNLAAKAGGLKGLGAAFSGLTGALAGGAITLALVGIAEALAKTGEEARNAEDAMKRYKDVAQGIQQGQVDNPFNPIGNKASQDAALKAVDDFAAKYKAAVGKSLDRQSLMDIVMGVDSPGARKAREEIESTLITADRIGGSEGFRNAMGIGAMFTPLAGAVRQGQGAFTDLTGEIEGFLAVAPEVNELNWTQWLDQAGRSEAINALAGASLEKFGRITSENAPRIKKSLDGSRDGLTGFSAEAEIMALALGGTADEVNVHAMQLASALKIYGDSPRGIAQAMTELGFSSKEITAAMQAVGISAEAAGEASKFGFGSVADATGLAGSALALNTPLLYDGSDGITELARALSDSTGLDAGFLTNTMHAAGVGASDMATALSNAGVPITTIKDVLSDMGYPASQASAALEAVAVAGKKISEPGVWSSSDAMEFSAAIEAIAEGGEDAASQVDALRNAIDRLNGGVISSDRQLAAFNAAIAQAQSAFSLTDAEIADMGAAWTGWGDAIDDTTGAINTQTSAGQKLFAAVDTLGSEALKTAKGEFDRVYQSTGNLTAATDAARQSIEGQINAFVRSAKAVGLNDDEIAALLDRYGLIPDEILTEVSAVGAVDAASNLSGIVAMLGQMKPGVKFPVGMLDEGARKKLQDLGVDLQQLEDGTWTAALDTDPTLARQQVTDFTQWASTQAPPKIDLELVQKPARDQVQHLLDFVNSSQGKMWIDANPEQARKVLEFLVQVTGATKADMQMGANGQPGAEDAQRLAQWISTIWTNLNTGANTDPAARGVGDVVGWINGIWSSVTTGARTKNAYDDVGGLLGWIASRTAYVTIGATIGNSVGNAISRIQSMLGFGSANGNYWHPTAHGGMQLKQFANGGFSHYRTGFNGGKERHQAFITKTLRVFGEPETRGEAYIPLAKAKRARSMAILNQVADKFDVDVVPKDQSRVRKYADGGVTGGLKPAMQTAGVGNQITIIQNNPIAEPDTTSIRRAAQLLTARG